MSRIARLPLRAKRASLAVALLSVGVLVAACGAGTTSSTPAGDSSASVQYTRAFTYARCMRQHGEPDFPDPHNPGGFSTGALAQLDTASRQFVSANNTCQRSLPNDGQPTVTELQHTIKAGLRFARCMRAHGVNLPDPGISGTHLTINLANVNTDSPQYNAAGHLCATAPGA